jgi:hypothetical protein
MELLSRNETWMAGKCPKHVLFFVRFLNGEDHRTKMRLLFFSLPCLFAKGIDR